MKQMIRRMAVVGAIILMGMGAQQLMAQEQQQQRQRPDRQNFDPAQMQQRMMERYKESFEVTNEDEWKIIQERIQKVTEARREVGFGGGRMFGGMRPGGNNAPGEQGQGGGRRAFGGEQNAAMQELQQAIESKATAEQLKIKLAKVRDDRKQKQAKLDQAQEELKKVLNVRREAIAVTMGLLN
jgi:hypothetical protein